ncbi:MAG: amidohydrolase [Rhodothermales bacterium]|nr:amidohydrolase [Rhodothermales bacterium]
MRYPDPTVAASVSAGRIPLTLFFCPMGTRTFILPFSLLCTLTLAAPGCYREAPADLVLRGGSVYTMASPARAEAVVVRGTRIVFVGADAEVGRFVGPATRVVDLAGRMVLPGFRDTHAHPATSGVELNECRLDDLAMAEAILAQIQTCAETTPAGAWLRGGGWALPAFPRANPTRDALDAATPDHPAFLLAADGHSAWVNSLALERAGITRATPDPPNGRIERDNSGAPSGTLREAAVDLVNRALPAYTADQWRAGIQDALRLANSFGITAVHEAALTPESLEAYAALAAEQRLSARVIGALFVSPEGGLAQVDSFISVRARHPATPFFRIDAAKLMADGVIESGTAALLAPYLGASEAAEVAEVAAATGPVTGPATGPVTGPATGPVTGPATYRPGQLDTLVAALDVSDFQIHIHAIGDRAVRMSLDAIAHARRDGSHSAPPILVHIQLIDPADLPRFAELGVVGSFQPLWAYADTYITELTEPVLGPERSRWLYPIASLSATGAVVAGGSDWNVSSMNPLDAIQVGITRRALEDSTGPAWIPQERVDLTTLLRMYTINAAMAAGDAGENGSLEVGKQADIVVLERDLYAIPPHDIHRVRVDMTVVDGVVVYSRAP